MPRVLLIRLALMAATAMLSLQASTPALAENRIPAGGAFMNSYTSDPYFDPKSLYSQSHSQGDIGGQPLLVEPPGTPPPCSLFDTACAQAWRRRHHS